MDKNLQNLNSWRLQAFEIHIAYKYRHMTFSITQANDSHPLFSFYFPFASNMNSENSSITTPFRYLQTKPFPARVCILLLDSDRSSVERTEAILTSCQYKVIVAERATEALSMVGESRREIDIVVTEFDLPDMDGLMFIEKVLEIRRLPVFVLSAFESFEVKMYCLLNGAEFCYDKPLNKVIAEGLCEFIVPRSGSSATSEISYNILDSPASRNANMHVVDDLILENREEDVADNFRVISKKRKISWTPELHTNFVGAVLAIGFFVARPKSILKLMNTPELTTAHVASHLQRYRAQVMGKASQTMPNRMAPVFPTLEGSIAKRPCVMSPDPYKGIGCGIYNQLALRFKVLEQINHQNTLVNQNVAGTSRDKNVNKNHT